jgi:hypothetical protein
MPKLLVVRRPVRSGYEYGRTIAILDLDRQRSLYGPIALMHATKDGGPVLRDHSSWRTVCGLLVSGQRWSLMLQFRRFYKKRPPDPF